MAKIIKFPNSKPKVKLNTIELEAKKTNWNRKPLTLMMQSDMWDKCEITNDEIEMFRTIW